MTSSGLRANNEENERLVTTSTSSLLDAQTNTSHLRDDGGYGWVIVAVSFLAQLLGYGVSYTIGVFLIQIKKEYPEGGETTISWIASIMIAMLHVAGPFASIMINLYGCRTVSVIGHILTAIGFSLSYFANGVYVLYVTLGFIAGTGLGFIYLPSIVAVAQYFSRRRSMAIGISVAGSGAGTFVFEWLNGFLLAHYTWREGLLISGGIIFACTILSLLYKPPPPDVNFRRAKIEPRPSIHQFYGSIQHDPSEYEMENACLASLREMIDFDLLKNKYFITFLLADILTSIAFNVPFIFIPAIEQEVRQSPKSSLLGLIGVSSVISRLIIGYICDMKFINRHFLYAGCLLVAGVSTAISPVLLTLNALRGYSVVFGFSIGGYMCLTSLVLVDMLSIEKLNDAYGILLFIQAIGFFIGLPVVAFFFDIFGNFHIGFYFAGSLITVCGLIQFIMAIKRRLKASRAHRRH